MRAVEIQGAFGLENLTVVDRPEPEPGPGEVLLRMKAASLNYRDLLTVRGTYNPRQPLPLIPCSDGAGEVVEVGSGVTRVAPGDRVATLFCQKWLGGEPTPEKIRSTLGGPLDGTLAELMVLPEDGMVKVPEELSDTEAATLGCAGLTAWSALVTQGSVKAGDTVLVLGTGGVSIFALQFARMLGARVVVTSSSEEKLFLAREQGAEVCINYRENPGWGRMVLKMTGRRGVDLVVEVGGANTLGESLTAVRLGGQISLIGILSGDRSNLNIVPAFMKNVRIQGIFVGHRDGFEAMNRAIATHGLRPAVDRVFHFTEVRKALELMAAGRHFGKICLSF